MSSSITRASCLLHVLFRSVLLFPSPFPPWRAEGAPWPAISLVPTLEKVIALGSDSSPPKSSPHNPHIPLMSVQKVVRAFESRETFVLVCVVVNPQINSVGFLWSIRKVCGSV